MTNRKKRKRGLSLLLGGMLLLSAPFQVIAEDEPQTVNPTEETPAEATEQPVEAQEPVAVTETPVETAAPEPVVEVPVQPATPEATVLPATPQPVAPTAAPVEKVEETPAPAPVETTQPSAAPEVKEATVAPTPEATEEAEKKEEKNSYEGLQKLNAVTSDGVRVDASFNAGTFGEEELPELVVKDLSEKKAIASAKKALPDQKIEEAKSVDISFHLNGKEVQPLKGQEVSVKIDLPESLNPGNEQGEYYLAHEHEGTSELVSTADISSSEASFQTDSFSVFTIFWTADGRQRAELTVHYVDELRNEIGRNQPTETLTDASGSINIDEKYGVNTINNYRYYNAYILDNGKENPITDIRYQRTQDGRYFTYTVSYLNNGETVKEDVTNTTDGVIRRNIYLKYHTVLSGNRSASVYFLLTPTSDADSNATKHWSSDSIAVGLGTASVNLSEAVFANDNKNVFKERNGNGNLSNYINNWPDGTKGATWTITSKNTKGQWDAITTSVAKEYQTYLQKQLGTSTRIEKGDIESITVIPYKISINNGNVRTTGGNTEAIHIDSTISIVCKRAYQYAFVVDYPSGSRFADGTVKDGAKAIHVSEKQSSPDVITTQDLPESSKIPQTITDQKGISYAFDGWHRKANYSDNIASFAYTPSMEEITADGGTITFYARYVQTTKKINVTKVWNDNDNQDGIRPQSVTVNLLAGGTQKESQILTAGGNWTGTFENLPILNEDGKKINYTVSETPVQGYEQPSVTGSEDSGFTITNKHTAEKVNISGNKIWDDDQNRDGKRPESIIVRLRKNGTEIDRRTVSGDSKANTWEYSFTDLPKYENGRAITYTVTEDAVENYTTSVNDQNHDITNSYTPSKTSVTVNKIWNDNDNQDGIRPDAITVKLLADGTDTGKTETLSAVTDWTATFGNLKEFRDGGQKISYTVEETAVSGYSAAVTGDAVTGYTITNTHTPEIRSITGKKIWNDNSNQDGKRPESVTIRLYANGREVESRELSGEASSNEWNYTFDNLPKNSGGTEISYTVTEDAVTGYSSVTDGYNITNSYTPEKTSISVVKEWDDNHNQDGIRPDEVVIQLYANGDKTNTVTLNDQNNWNASFTDLPVYRDGQKIVYTVDEQTQVNGYQSDVSGNAEEGFRITNAHQPETVDIHGTKTWVDETNKDNNRPESVTIRLHADGDPVEDQVQSVTGLSTDNTWTYAFTGLPKYKNGTAIRYTVTEDQVRDYTSVVNDTDYNITNTYNPDLTSVSVTKSWADHQNQDGKRPGSVKVTLLENGKKTDQTLTLTEASNWSGTFENLPVRKDEKEVVYTVQEEPVEGYTSVTDGDAVTGFIIENIHTPETTEIHGTKTWVDEKNKDNNRPSSVTVRLYANDALVEDQVQSVTGDMKADTWTYAFTDLPKYADGKMIKYTVSEDQVENYTSEVNNENYNITNKHADNKTSVNVTKHWEDHDNQDGKRPENVTVQLLENGNVTDQKLTLSENNKWSGTFENLPIIKNQKKVVYTVQEISVKGYTTHYNGTAETGYVITNIHTPETMDISGTKTWDDGNNQDGKRPESIIVRLHANGEIVQSMTMTGDENVWNYEFKDVPVYANGEKIEYAVTEDAVDNYSVKYNGYHLTNSRTPEKTSVSVTKNWEDHQNQDGKRPHDVTVRLLANDQDTGKKVTLSEDNNWEAAFTNLDLYSNGKRILYTVEEDSVKGYESAVSGDQETGYIITNIHEPETTSVQGTKTWKDNDNKAGRRPESITVRLHADGKLIQSKEVTDNSGKWTYAFNDVPVYEDGKIIQYTITEDAVENYSTHIDGYNLTNTYIPEKTSLTVTKSWNDDNNRDGIRPDEVKITLLENGKETGRAIPLTAQNHWTATFQDLDLYENGKKITYSVKEDAVDGYTGSVSGDAKTGYVITNTHTPETITVNDPPVRKTITGDRPSDQSVFRFTMKADNQAYPMPEGSEDGIKTVSHEGAGSIEFGNITFSDPGTYTYSISEENDQIAGYQYDTGVFQVTYVINRKADGSLSSTRTITRDGKQFDEAEFINHYTAKKDDQNKASENQNKPSEKNIPTEKNTNGHYEKNSEHSPDTGDHSGIWMYAGILIVMIGIVGAVVHIRNN